MVVDKKTFLKKINDDIGPNRNPEYVTGTALILAEYHKARILDVYKRFRKNNFWPEIRYYSLILLTAASMMLLGLEMYKDPEVHKKLEPAIEYIKNNGKKLKDYIRCDNHEMQFL